MGQHYVALATRLEIQRKLLHQWANRLKIFDPEHYDKRLDDPNIGPLIYQGFSWIRQLLQDGHKLEQRYSVRPAKIHESMESPTAFRHWLMSKFNSMPHKLRSRRDVQSLQPYQAVQSGPSSGEHHDTQYVAVDKVRWIIQDKEQFESLFQSLSDLIADINAVIPPQRGDSTNTALQHEAANLSSVSELGTIKTVLPNEDVNITCRVENGIDQEKDSISEAHSETFKRAIEPPDPGSNWSDLGQWLRSGAGIYWISGKSTSTKYLFENYGAPELLQEWVGSRESIMGNFLLWNVGTLEQNTCCGVARGLLYHVLKENQSLIPHMWQEARSGIKNLKLPSSTELKWALQQLDEVSKQAAFAFFIDAPPPVKRQLSIGVAPPIFLKWLASVANERHQSTAVAEQGGSSDGCRLVSLHPTFQEWLTYMTNRGGASDTNRQLSLNPLTSDGCRLRRPLIGVARTPAQRYRRVQSSHREGISFIQEFATSAHIKILLSSRPINTETWKNMSTTQFGLIFAEMATAYLNEADVRELIITLQDKAEGVFLWVVLACRTLLDRFDAYDSADEIQRAVDRLPPELEDLLRSIIEDIPERVRQQASKMLRLCYIRGPVEDMSFISTFAMAWAVEKGIGSLEIRGDASKGHLMGPGGDTPFVNFMHRTVFEFLDNTDALKMDCLKIDDDGFDPTAALAFIDSFMLFLDVRHIDEGDFTVLNSLIILTDLLKTQPSHLAAVLDSILMAIKQPRSSMDQHEQNKGYRSRSPTRLYIGLNNEVDLTLRFFRNKLNDKHITLLLAAELNPDTCISKPDAQEFDTVQRARTTSERLNLLVPAVLQPMMKLILEYFIDDRLVPVTTIGILLDSGCDPNQMVVEHYKNTTP
ncbi:hypothetical protein BM1_02709 [Bipolaris maydis]|nr:hypothetical protein BM1_02709 [Bipolaris maydis]